MSKRFESSVLGAKHTEIFIQSWVPEEPRGTIVITHGLAEHSECYHDLAKDLTRDRWQVYGWDLRGHGRSEGKRGYVDRFSDFESDLAAVLQRVRRDTKETPGPLILLGHSLGGLITLSYLIHNSKAVSSLAALCLSSPALGISTEVPAIKNKLAHWASEWMPKLTLFNEIRYRDLSRDENILKSYEHDPLRHDKISPRLYLGMLEAFVSVEENAQSITCPVLMQLSGVDRIVSMEASKQVFEKLGTKKKFLEIYPDSLHEIFNDLDRDQAVADLKRFLNQLP